MSNLISSARPATIGLSDLHELSTDQAIAELQAFVAGVRGARPIELAFEAPASESEQPQGGLDIAPRASDLSGKGGR
jgi:hypothetical protein